MPTVTFFHAHPDDEAIATGGTMVGLADAGHRVVLVTATRGELGEEPEGLLDPGETLVDRRRAELAEACRILRVDRQEFLDYLDSGMAGTSDNDRPGSFATADIDEAAAALARVLDEEASDVLVIYDEHGGYGHPDHVQVHRVGMRAAELAGTPIVYMATMDRDFFAELAAEADQLDWQPPENVSEGMDTMGEPASRITTEVDVTRWTSLKREAMRAHASQIAETSFFLAMPDDTFSVVWGREWYIRVRPEVSGWGLSEASRPATESPPREKELLLTTARDGVAAS
jgi:LmbE family N-acetylglucosaminyl deacetylase